MSSHCPDSTFGFIFWQSIKDESQNTPPHQPRGRGGGRLPRTKYIHEYIDCEVFFGIDRIDWLRRATKKYEFEWPTDSPSPRYIHKPRESASYKPRMKVHEAHRRFWDNDSAAARYLARRTFQTPVFPKSIDRSSGKLLPSHLGRVFDFRVQAHLHRFFYFCTPRLTGGSKCAMIWRRF